MLVAEPDAQRLKMIATAAQELGVENLSNISAEYFNDRSARTIAGPDLRHPPNDRSAARRSQIDRRCQRSLHPDAHLYLEISGQS